MQLDDGYFANPHSDWTPQLLISKGSFVRNVSCRKMRSNWVHPEFSYFYPPTTATTIVFALVAALLCPTELHTFLGTKFGLEDLVSVQKHNLLQLGTCSAYSKFGLLHKVKPVQLPQVSYRSILLKNFDFPDISEYYCWSFLEPILPFISAWKDISWFESTLHS